MEDNRSAARELMAQHLRAGDPTGWFEPLYSSAAGNPARIPWADMRPNPNLVSWLKANPTSARSGNALVVGCGLGDDAEALAARGLSVTAFDISTTAIEWCRRRFPGSIVDYQVADVCNLPADWFDKFDFVFEAYTLQVLPRDVRVRACDQIVRCLGPAGQLLVIARARETHEPEGDMPWPLTRADLSEFERMGLQLTGLEDYLYEEKTPVRRFRALFARAEEALARD
jgi:ubiquinone/menaquinone biosynthesis C-methylase UbiE